MADAITGKIKRKYMAHYINASTVPETPAYVRLGDDLEEYNVEMNANVNKTNDITGKTSTNIDGYEPQSAVEPYYAVVGNPLHTRLQKIIDERQTLDDLKTDVLDVHLWEEDAVDKGSFVAYREEAIIEVGSYGGDVSGYQIPFNLHYTGARVKGLFKVADKTFTPDTPAA